MNTTHRLMSKLDAAKAVGIDRSTLETHFIQTGRVTVYKAAPRVYRIDLDELLEAMKTYAQEVAKTG